MIKHQQASGMKSRDTLVGLFIQLWFISEVKYICKPITAKCIHLKPNPLYYVCYPEIVIVIYLENNYLFVH